MICVSYVNQVYHLRERHENTGTSIKYQHGARREPFLQACISVSPMTSGYQNDL